MKLIHTADWHLGASFYGFERTAEHTHFLTWLSNTVREERPDALLVSGDIFDNANPPAQAERQLFDFLNGITAENDSLKVILTSGNHDSGYRLEAPRALYRRSGIEVRGIVQRDGKDGIDYKSMLIPLKSEEDGGRQVIVMAVPYLRGEDLAQGADYSRAMRKFFDTLAETARKEYGTGAQLVLMAHFCAAGSEINAEEHSERLIVGDRNMVNAEKLSDGIAYTALGHIHKAQKVAGQVNVIYCGSPLPMMFSEKNYHHIVTRVNITKDKVEVAPLLYEPLRGMLTVPSTGSAGIEEVLRLLSRLPKAHKGENSVEAADDEVMNAAAAEESRGKGVFSLRSRDESADRWPYLEVKVRETAPDPSLVGAIVDALEGKAVRLCRIVRVRPNGDRSNETAQMMNFDDLRKINPAQIARTIYQSRYGRDMPDEVARLFAKVKRRCEHNMNTGGEEDA